MAWHAAARCSGVVRSTVARLPNRRLLQCSGHVLDSSHQLRARRFNSPATDKAMPVSLAHPCSRVCHSSCLSTGSCYTALDVFWSAPHSGRLTGCRAYASALWLSGSPMTDYPEVPGSSPYGPALLALAHNTDTD